MTEKDYNPNMKEKKAMKKQEVVNTPSTKAPTVEKAKEEKADKKISEEKGERKQETKKQTKPKVKKEEAIVNSYNLPISTKVAGAICKFIKGKEIQTAINEMEKVTKLKLAVPMKGEIPHRKGKGMMSGRFPIKAANNFIKSLKTLQGNSNVNEIESPVIIEAYANQASRPAGKFGAIRKKRTHIMIKAKSKARREK